MDRPASYNHPKCKCSSFNQRDSNPISIPKSIPISIPIPAAMVHNSDSICQDVDDHEESSRGFHSPWQLPIQAVGRSQAVAGGLKNASSNFQFAESSGTPVADFGSAPWRDDSHEIQYQQSLSPLSHFAGRFTLLA
mmetsp:Transcript_27970/g.76965  ORF Transcript_27970/g.76965 Transcript_27970/m.76965 type:complete len:136 (-) Transcript_27970:10974-11381(-)